MTDLKYRLLDLKVSDLLVDLLGLFTQERRTCIFPASDGGSHASDRVSSRSEDGGWSGGSGGAGGGKTHFFHGERVGSEVENQDLVYERDFDEKEWKD